LEQTLAPGGVCCLGSINITQFINEFYTDIDYDKLKKYATYMVRFLDNVNEYSNAPLPEYMDSMRNKRRIGIGIMGWGSALFMLGVKFASERASIIRDTLMQTLARTVYEASIDLAIEKGMFTYCNPIKHSSGKFVNSLGLSPEYMEKLRTTGIRNSSLLSIQPNGNSSIFANIVSGGLEPIFMPEYIRTIIVSVAPDEIVDVTPKWYEGEWFETDMFKFTKEGDEELLRGVYNGITYKIDKNRGLLKEVECKDYSVRKLMELGKWNPTDEYVVTALNGLTVDDHLNDLIGFTKYIDSAVSKTVNLPNDYSFEDFKDIYLTAYKSGHIKGITTYRAGTMAAVLSEKETENNGYEEEIILDNVKMLDSSDASMKVLKAEGRKWYITIVWNETKTRPFALFVHTNHHEKSVTTHDAIDRLLLLAEYKKIPTKFILEAKEKIDTDNNATKITRLISLLLRHGVAIKNIVATLHKIDNVFVGSFLFQITKYLASFIKNGEKVENEKCLECGSSNIVFQEGCKVCVDCGNSKCG
jgi:ribonucleoside-diphosphate reductase alpha chain